MSVDKYDPARDVTPEFIQTVDSWIATSGEVFVILRYLRAGGAKGYAFCYTIDEFRGLVAEVSVGTDIEVFRQRQLPIPGIVTESFIAETLAAIPTHSEFILVSRKRKPDSVISEYGEFGESEFLRSELEACFGQDVAVGVCPEFLAPDNPDLISASKGGIDGHGSAA